MTCLKNISIFIILIVFFINSSLFAQGLVFGIVGKSVDDFNFIDTYKGCNQAAKQFGDKCVLLGSTGSANIRTQQKAIKKALETKEFSALAISVINSKFIAQTIENTKIPIITFDSPFENKYKHLSKSYVGINNTQFGEDLAKIVKQLQPKGGSVCFMSIQYDPNLQLRVDGMRTELKISKEAKWQEYKRCLWNTSDNMERPLLQLKLTLNYLKPDAFISVGHWPILDIDGYKKTIEPIKEDIINKKHIIVLGIGAKSIPEVELLMKKGLLHGYVSIDFKEIGERSYHIMKDIVNGEKVDSLNFIPNIIRTIK